MPNRPTPSPLPWLQQLRVRLGLLGMAAVLGAVGLTGFTLLEHAERDTLVQREHLELAEAERTAGLLEQRVRSQIRSLEVAGHSIPTRALASADTLQSTLRARPLLLAQFDTLSFVRPDGRIEVFHDERGFHQPGLNVADRPYFREALRTEQAVVSEPVIGRMSSEPIVLFVHPLHNEGRLAGLLMGSLRLRSGALLAGLEEVGGHAGTGLVVVTDAAGNIIAHPKAELIGAQASAEARLARPMATWARAGKPMKAVATDVSDETSLAAVAALPAAKWLVWRLEPRAEVLAPLAAARVRALWTGAGVAGLLLLPLLLAMWWMLRPLQLLEARAERLFDPHLAATEDWPEASGEIGELMAVLRRVATERMNLEQHNARMLRQLQSVMAAAPLGILVTRERRFELVSPEACRMLGRAEADLLGQPAEIIYADSEAYQRLGAQVATAFQQRKAFDGELQFLRFGSGRFWGRLNGQPVDWGDPGAGTIWTLTDIDEHVATRQQLEWAASHDPLTGLANRKALLHRLDRIVSEGPCEHASALLLLDLDRFKPVNDQHGHAAGDAVLRQVAQAIAGCLRTADMPARLGGDEFAVVLEHCPEDAAVRIAETIRHSITSLKVDWQGAPLQVGVSVGVAALQPEYEEAALWLAAADSACYLAKASGRDAVKRAPLKAAEKSLLS